MPDTQTVLTGHIDGCADPMRAVDPNGDTWCIGCDQQLHTDDTDTASTGADS